MIGYIAIRLLAPEGDSGALALYVLATYSLIASVIAGAILAVIGMVRREKWRALSWFSLVLNLIALAVLLKMSI